MYMRPEAEPGPNATEGSAVPAPTNHVLSLAQVAAGRDIAHAKYVAQLRSMYQILHVSRSTGSTDYY